MNEKGQTMIEVLLALAIGVIIIAGISKAVNTSLSSSQFGKNQSSANQYAQEGMEIARNFTSLPTGSYCLMKGKTTLAGDQPTASGCPQNVDAFAREVNIQKTNANVTKITVTVGWSDSKCYAPRSETASSLGTGDPTSTPTPTLTPTPAFTCQDASSISTLSSSYCHRVQLVSCFSDPEAVQAP